MYIGALQANQAVYGGYQSARVNGIAQNQGRASQSESAGRFDQVDLAKNRLKTGSMIDENQSADGVKGKECETCANRKYQDGSNDPGVSFKTPTKIDPKTAATAVMGHEMEHVSRERSKAKAEGKEVVQQSVSIQNAMCPECGKTYVAGGLTRTTTKSVSNKFDAAQTSQVGRNLDMIA